MHNYLRKELTEVKKLLVENSSAKKRTKAQQ
jgi:hypothetical protein